jgi:hypothetical protein
MRYMFRLFRCKKAKTPRSGAPNILPVCDPDSVVTESSMTDQS